MVHDTSGSSQNDLTELSGWQQVVSPSLDIVNFDVESWGDHTTLVQSTVQLNDNLTRSVVINVFELTDVAFEVSIGHQSKQTCYTQKGNVEEY